METLYADGYHGPDDGAPDEGWAASLDFLAPAWPWLRGRHLLRILDFGTGQSRIPERLRQDGHRVIAIDLAPPLRPHPDRLTGALPLELPADSFDLVFAYQVFEHIPEPRPIFHELLHLVRPGGLLLVHTDMEVPERAGGLESWWYVLPPDHCVFYRHRTFDVLVEAARAEVVLRESAMVLIRKSLDRTQDDGE